jgi:uncharacterized caspase-like protein
MRWAAWVVAAATVLAAGMGSAQAPPAKLALVIGNADYNGDARIDVSEAGLAASEAAGFVPDLRNPLNDAADIRDALKGIGFAVNYVENADGATMSTALANFGAKVAEAPTDAQVVIYYAGHAIQVDGANFLIPVGAKLPAADFSRMPSTQAQTILGRVAVSTNEVLDQFREPSAPGVNLLILDSCRNNPWERRMRGLSRTAAQTRGMADLRANIARTIVAFATQPGDIAQDGTGRNSPFAGELKQSLAKPGTVLEMLDGVGSAVQRATNSRQTPWFQSASIGQVCLAACAPSSSAALAASEDAMFGAAQAFGSPTLYRLYLQAFPTGRFAAAARQGIVQAAASPISDATRCSRFSVFGDINLYFEADSARMPAILSETVDLALARLLPQVRVIQDFCGMPKLLVTGHSDTSATADVSMALSARRASAVRDMLVAKGYPAADIVTEAKGETELAMPTLDGVREPLNRRVTVTLLK